MIRINLIPTKAARRKEGAIVQLIVGAVVIAGALGACFWMNKNMQSKVDIKQRKIAELNAKLNQLNSILKEVESFEKKKKDLQKKIKTIQELNDKRTGPVKLLEEFTYVLPRKAWIRTYREVDKQLSLEGTAVDGPTVSDFIDSMRDSGFFNNVQLIQVSQSENKTGEKMQNFTVNCRVNYSASRKV